ncbi:hypothetical protein FOZ63_020012 [Perkinsus olseni]|uniref:Uncharacterized protein n=1 Tax=Perkinsus olseni TaxID=32597 RepID=A0A7J6PXP6_PEROL|nr:hypothetical protein FOZ63_020012 [Perkinsus olseni]
MSVGRPSLDPLSSSAATPGSSSSSSSRDPLKNPFQLASRSADLKPVSGSNASAPDESPDGAAKHSPPVAAAATRTYHSVEEFMGGTDFEGPTVGTLPSTWEGAAAALKDGKFKAAVRMAEAGGENSTGEERQLWGAVKVFSLMMLSDWTLAGEEIAAMQEGMEGDDADLDEAKFWISLYSALLPCCASPSPTVEVLTRASGQLRRIAAASPWQETVFLKSEALLSAQMGDLDEVNRLYRSCLLPRAADGDHRDELLMELTNLLLRVGALPEAEDTLAEIRSEDCSEHARALIALAKEDYATALKSLQRCSRPSPNIEACLQFYLGHITPATTILEEMVRDQTATLDSLANLSVLYNFKLAAEASTAKKTLLSVVSSTRLNDRFELAVLESL